MGRPRFRDVELSLIERDVSGNLVLDRNLAVVSGRSSSEITVPLVVPRASAIARCAANGPLREFLCGLLCKLGVGCLGT